MALSTTQSIWRSGGGDQTRTAYCGTATMIAEFYIDPTADDTTRAKVSSATGAADLILPAGAVVYQIQVDAAGTGGTTPTFEMGWIGYSDASQFDTNGLVNAGDADAGKQMINWQAATAGDDMGVPMQSDQMVYITGGGTTGDKATGGTITGHLLYFVQDPLLGQQNV